ncbi:hypothetical protein N7532_009333 [Penicillium argentinense]|uniref:Cyanovirin-N domain-containing protein n=1 Tax=Penicillium argentinense TaxID=1131581 RepID=A0A9W9EZ27_9EURO|nr:uncharacterized protein N7532_009333 [Penicillium argentinense]KAJ5090649.1 hypothetical protein N7532_009333 [Penicillium argentinense]
MSFQKTACDVHLNSKPGATSLVAICNNDEGSGLETDLLLDDYLGNEDVLMLGHIAWGGKGFSKNARNMSISSDGPDREPILHCDLVGQDGEFVSNEIDLADHIANIDGELVVLPSGFDQLVKSQPLVMTATDFIQKIQPFTGVRSHTHLKFKAHDFLKMVMSSRRTTLLRSFRIAINYIYPSSCHIQWSTLYTPTHTTKMNILPVLRARPLTTIPFRQVLPLTRHIQTQTTDPTTDQWILDRQALKPDRAETCQSGTDDEVGHHKSPYDGTKTTVENEISALREEYLLEGDAHDPLLVSPANLDVSLVLDPMIGVVHGAPTLRSMKGWCNKHRLVLLRTEPYEVRKYEDVFVRFVGKKVCSALLWRLGGFWFRG